MSFPILEEQWQRSRLRNYNVKRSLNNAGNLNRKLRNNSNNSNTSDTQPIQKQCAVENIPPHVHDASKRWLGCEASSSHHQDAFCFSQVICEGGNPVLGGQKCSVAADAAVPPKASTHKKQNHRNATCENKHAVWTCDPILFNQSCTPHGRFCTARGPAHSEAQQHV